MIPFCRFCGRLTLHPAVVIAGCPVGPKFAKRHGLLPPVAQTRGLVPRSWAPAAPRRSVATRDDRTADLFGAAP